MSDHSAALAMREATKAAIAALFEDTWSAQYQRCMFAIDAIPLPDEPAPGAAAWRAGMTAEQNAIIDRLIDSQFAAGAKFGWNCAAKDDEQRYQSCINDRVVGHKEAIRKAKEADASIAPVPPPEVDVMGLLDKFEKAAIEVGHDTGASSARVESSGKELDGLRAALAAQLQRWTG